MDGLALVATRLVYASDRNGVLLGIKMSDSGAPDIAGSGFSHSTGYVFAPVEATEALAVYDTVAASYGHLSLQTRDHSYLEFSFTRPGVLRSLAPKLGRPANAVAIEIRFYEIPDKPPGQFHLLTVDGGRQLLAYTFQDVADSQLWALLRSLPRPAA